MATLTQYHSEIDECRTAMIAEDYASARKKLTLARVTLAAIPDSELDGERIEFQRNLDTLTDAIKELESDQKKSSRFTEGPLAFAKIVQVRE